MKRHHVPALKHQPTYPGQNAVQHRFMILPSPLGVSHAEFRDRHFEFGTRPSELGTSPATR
jgi:hypothetical protein